MTKSKTKILTLFTAVVLLCLCVAAFAACTKSESQETYTVTFMVENDGSWQQYGAAAEVADGKITMPSNPTKTYYSFVGWYENQDFSGEVFKNENISANKTVYARFTAKQADVYINGESQGKQNIVDVVSGSYNPGEGLEFDGWYTNADCTVKYENSDDAIELYARSVARVTFNNGYQTVYTVDLLPNTVFANPANTVTTLENGDKSTLEADQIIKFYMDSSAIYYVDEDGNAFDFTKPIEKSVTINVEWQTPYLNFVENEATGNLVCTGWSNTVDTQHEDVVNFPVIRIPSKTILEETERNVESYYAQQQANTNGNLQKATSARTVIFAEGIKFISYFGIDGIASPGTPGSLENVVLPSTLKIIQNSFNAFNNVRSFDIPDGVEIILQSFWGHNNIGTYDQSAMIIDTVNKTVDNYMIMRQPYDFAINIPDSVIDLSDVPSNFVFSENSAFYKDEKGRIFKHDSRGTLLVMDQNVDENGVVTVEEGIVGIQVGAFADLVKMQYLDLPSTWSYVGYNEDIANYPFYYHGKNNNQTRLYDETQKDAMVGVFYPHAYAIFDNLNNNVYGVMGMVGYEGSYKKSALFKKVRINMVSLPDTIPASALAFNTSTNDASRRATNYKDYTWKNAVGKTAFIGTAESGDITVTITANSTQASVKNKIFTFTAQSGDVVTLAQVKEAVGITDSHRITSLSQFGSSVELGKAFNSNLYLDLSYEYIYGGYSLKKDGDGNYIRNEFGNGLTVIGYDESNEVSDGNGYYIVNIPDEVDGIPVTEIAANAFSSYEDLNKIVIVSVPASVQKIGDAAFKDMANLKQVQLFSGNLAYIGAHAFEGCDSLTTIALPLGSVKYIGPYAFKNRGIKTFSDLDGNTDISTFESGQYYIPGSGAISIRRYVSTSVEKQWNSDHSKQVDITVYDVEFVALAGGAAISNSMAVGESQRASYTAKLGEETAVERFHVLEGSYYYGTTNNNGSKLGHKGIIFGIVSRIDKNAFTDMNNEKCLEIKAVETTNEDGTTVTTYTSALHYYHAVNEAADKDDYWTDENLVKTMDSSIFEDGWWEGWTEENNPEDYARLAAAMAAAQNYPIPSRSTTWRCVLQ